MRRSPLLPLALILAAVVPAAVAALLATGAGAAPGDSPGPKQASLEGYETGRRAELRPTVPIADRAGEETRSVLSLKLPRLERGDRVRFNGEVTITNTCVEQIGRCIGRTYDFDPKLRARIVIAPGKNVHSRGNTVDVSRSVGLTCGQTRPNRNHHCPLVVKEGSFEVEELRDLPCKANGCRLNMLLDASNRRASSDQYVVVGSDQPDGSVEGGKARLSAAVSNGGVEVERSGTTKIRDKTLKASFSGGKTVVYSQRLGNLQRGDVLLVNSKQRTAIQGLPYFISNQIVIGTKPTATGPSRLSRRIVSRSGLATETTGFNCTIGSSAFQSPCVAVKSGLASIERRVTDKRGRDVPLYVNLVSRGFPKVVQARASFPPARVLKGGGLRVERLRLDPPEG